MIRYAITDGVRFDADARFTGLMQDAARWADEGIEFVQLREKDLSTGELLRIARTMVTIFREQNAKTKLLVNGRADVAVAAEADGVHLTSHLDELTTEQVRRIFARDAVVSASCHTLEDVKRARDAGVNWILFGPVFEKRVGGQIVVAGVGLEMLRQACFSAGIIPVLALGGVHTSMFELCCQAGAAGISGIRLFSQAAAAI
jgi:thiamine-phosphate pyrophosphorylase